jgi:hypothetical protein
MPAAPVLEEIGIKMSEITLLQRLSLSYKLDPVSPLLDKTGAFAYGAATGGDGDWDLQGLGDLDETIVLGPNDPGIYGMEDGVILTLSTTETQTLKNWNGWTAKGAHYPFAAAA